MGFWKATGRFRLLTAITFMMMGTSTLRAATLLDTLFGPDTNRLDAQLGFAYYQVYRGIMLSDNGRLLGPEAFAFTRHGGFFASARLRASIDLSAIETVGFSLPELALGWGTGKWLVRAGLIHSRVGTPWADDWQIPWRHGFIDHPQSQETLAHFPEVLASVEGRLRPRSWLELGAGISYRPFSLVDDPLLPQIALTARFNPGDFLFLAGISTHQFGRRSFSANPFLDRRYYTFLADVGWRWLSLRNVFEWYSWSETDGRMEDTHVLRLEPPLPKGFRLFVEIGALAQGTWDPTRWRGVLDLHFGWRIEHLEIFVEEHLGLSLWNGLPTDHRLNVGLLLNLEKDRPRVPVKEMKKDQ
jgi:hypothetical protein